ncbi:MAG: arginyl-tRNA synthetase [Candidatus Berkelbacteria bacterium Licking1014_7]|uniref:Arginine--tRNA ligase n=1 Tax=Candidatus Berkelbacteria bacterium Licking1014_7 TaxID=2017147 RepID=A0A554LK05_9BACT|nr:MAG: arginyl-tRNA synthetase [Candidatus Berkelbacteria bacterium Licking1014_7]
MDLVKKVIDGAVLRLYKLRSQKYSLDYKEQFGDLSTNLAFVLSSQIKDAPQKIAIAIKQKIEKEKFFEKVEIANAGFLNFTLSGDTIMKMLESENFNHSKKSDRKKIQIEFISANPTGPLTLGNARNAFTGDAIAKILRWSGQDVQTEYYVNDMGNQIETLGESVINSKLKTQMSKPPLKNQKFYVGEYIEEIGKRINGKNVQQIGERGAKIILQDYIKPLIKKLKIHFDRWQSEKALHQRYDIEQEVEKLRSQKFIQEKEGALWFLTKKFGDDKDRVLKKKNGQWTYLASDLLYLIDRKKRGFDKIIILLGADHSGYIKRILALGQSLGFKKDQIKILICQLARIKKGEKSLRMSKRAGNVIYLDELVGKVGLDASRYFFLEKNPNTHLDFDGQKALKRDLTNPVYYIQYGYVRAQSILRKCQISNIPAPKQAGKYQTNFKSQILNSQEKRLALKILALRPALSDISQTLEIYRLPHLALDLTRAFSNFYEKERVIDGETVNPLNLLLTQKFYTSIDLLLDMMGISKPEKM